VLQYLPLGSYLVLLPCQQSAVALKRKLGGLWVHRYQGAYKTSPLMDNTFM